MSDYEYWGFADPGAPKPQHTAFDLFLICVMSALIGAAGFAAVVLFMG